MTRALTLLWKLEVVIAGTFLVLMVLLIFAGGVARMLHYPLNWTGDAATCLFAWACFLCADIAWRNNSLMSIDILTDRLPERLQFALRMLNYALIDDLSHLSHHDGILPVLDQPHPQLPGNSGDQLFVGHAEPAGRLPPASAHHGAEGAAGAARRARGKPRRGRLVSRTAR